MTLSIEEKNNIIHYRIEKAYQALKEARDNVSMSNWNLAVNRLYYATFYMAIALNLSNGETAKSHSGVFSIISKNYIATGALNKEAGALYRKLFSMRQTGDYDDLFDWEEDDVVPLVNKTEALVNSMRELIKTAIS